MLPILFALLSIISVYSIYYTYQLPTEEYATFPLCTYQHTGQYDYTAKINPNLLYNQTILRPGEGTLYTKIIDYINLTFTYTFTSSHPTNITSIEYKTSAELESPGKWTKPFTATEMPDIFQLTSAVNCTQQKASTTLFLNYTQIDGLVGTIDGQIGTSKSSKYNLMIKPDIYITTDITVAEGDVRTIYESFAPSITIEFGEGAPSHISIGDLRHVRSDSLTGAHHIFHQSVVNWRIASLLATAITIPLLTATTWVYLKTKPPSPAKPIKKIIGPHKELIAETTQKPPEATTTINIKTLEDLAKISEALIKPILHSTSPTTNGQTIHIFYIMDNNTKYQFKTATPTEA